jgi:hypothetical protein
MKRFIAKHSPWSLAGHTLNYIFLGIMSLFTLYPFLYEIAASFSSSRAITAGEVFFWPVEFNTEAYKRLLEDGQLLHAMGNTVIVTAVGTLLNMVMTVMAAGGPWPVIDVHYLHHDLYIRHYPQFYPDKILGADGFLFRTLDARFDQYL